MEQTCNLHEVRVDDEFAKKSVEGFDTIPEVIIIRDVESEHPTNVNGNYPSCCVSLANCGMDYAQNTSLHGVQYLGERRRSCCERIWWIMLLAFSIFMCYSLIEDSFDKLVTSPIIESFSQYPMPIWEIPFPAITVCPLIKCRKTGFNVKQAEKKLINGNISEEERKLYFDIGLVCKPNQQVPLFNHTVDLITYNSLLKLAPRLNETIKNCTGPLDGIDYCSEFTPVMTNLGVCFGFNGLNKLEMYQDIVDMDEMLMKSRKVDGWQFENGYENNGTRNLYPFRAIPGKYGAFTFELDGSKLDRNCACEGPNEGFDIKLHTSGESPEFTTRYIRVPFNVDSKIIVKPKVVYTSNELWDPSMRRSCYYSLQRPLAFYKLYTQANCEVECLTNYTLNRCKCAAFYMPHNNLTKVCGFAEFKGGNVSMGSKYSEVDCAADAEKSFKEYPKGTEDIWDHETALDKCKCIPNCAWITYNPKISQEVNTDLELKPDVTRVTIMFQEDQFTLIERTVLYGMSQFVSDCGGCLGLFLGFSILSIFESMYFFSCRICCNIRMFGRHHWSGPPERTQVHATRDDSTKSTRTYILKRCQTSNAGEDVDKAIFYVYEPK